MIRGTHRTAGLNITLQRTDAGAPRNVAADITVQAHNLYAVKTDVELRIARPRGRHVPRT